MKSCSSDSNIICLRFVAQKKVESNITIVSTPNATVSWLPHYYDISCTSTRFSKVASDWMAGELLSVIKIYFLRILSTWDKIKHNFNSVSVGMALWRHQMELFSALLSLRNGNPPVRGRFLSQRTISTDLWCFFVVSLNMMLNKQSIDR